MLTDTTIRRAKPQSKPYRIKAKGERGLFVRVMPNGSKLWRWKFRFQGIEKSLSFGSYPEVSLAIARERRDEARKQLSSGVNPSAARRAEKLSAAGREDFETIALEWFAEEMANRADNHRFRILNRLKTHILPWIGDRAIKEITGPELLAVLRRIEAGGALETAHRAKQTCSQIFRFAFRTGRAERDPTADLRGALPAAKGKHHAAITEPKKVGELLRAIDAYQGHFVTKCALRLSPFVFLRPGELRKAEWSEIDFDAKEWRVPAKRMKMRVQHIVPLSDQAIRILRELEPLTGRGIPGKPDAPRYIFPGAHSRERPMSENAVLVALRRMDYSKEEMTGHGFRSLASTLLHEQGWGHQAIERQLAHCERNAVSAAYNYAEHLPERRKMMQGWSDYLDSLKRGSDVIPLRRSA